MLKQLPTDAEIPNLIQELHQAGSTNGLRLDSVAPLQPENDGPIQKLPYQISITGKYSQISQFTRDVGDLSRIITLDSLKLVNASEDQEGKGNKGELTLSAIATTYKAVRPKRLLQNWLRNRHKKKANLPRMSKNKRIGKS